eukprot:scaffold90264_cov39-Cyclotella_meneghiniana.AAC.1
MLNDNLTLGGSDKLRSSKEGGFGYSSGDTLVASDHQSEQFCHGCKTVLSQLPFRSKLILSAVHFSHDGVCLEDAEESLMNKQE